MMARFRTGASARVYPVTRMSTIWKANVKMFCDPHTPPYHALSTPDGIAPRTSNAIRATTRTVRMTANKYGSGIKRST